MQNSTELGLPPGLAETEISIFANARDTSPKSVKLGAILNAIQDGRRADRIAHLRALLARGDKDTYDAQKKYLPAITLSGSFERRNAAGLIQHSGLLQADFDKLPNPEEVRDLLGADPHTVAAFLSPSAQGVKALVRIPDDPERHLASFRAAERHFRERYGLELDASCKDVSRLCFVSHDPDLCINPDAVPLKLPDPECGQEESQELFDLAELPHPLYADQGDDETAGRLRSALGVLDAYPYDGWIRMGLALKGWNGPGAFEIWFDWSRTAENYKDHQDCWRRWQGFRPDSGIDESAVFRAATDAGWSLPRDEATAGGLEPWPDPEEITASLRPVEPLPPELIPEPLRPWLTDIARRMQCPLDFVTAACVVMLSILTGTRCAIRPKRKDAWQVVPNLWGAIVGLPSALKTPAVQEVTRPLQHLEAEAFKAHEQAQGEHERDLRNWNLKREVLEGELKKGYRGGKNAPDPFEVEDRIATHGESEPQSPVLRRFSTSDSTVPKLQELMAENPQGLLVLRDELAGFLQSLDREENVGDRAFHLEGWSGEASSTVDRIGRGTVRTELVCESIFGTIQPARLVPYLRSTLSGTDNDGLVQRFQVMVYPDSAPWEYVDDTPDEQAEQRAFTLIERLAEMDFPTEAGAVLEEGKLISHLRFSHDAQPLFVEWLTELEEVKLRNSDESPVMLEHLGKFRSLMPGLALVFHLVDVADGKASGPVSLKAAELAAAWCAYLESHARRIYGMAEDITRRAAGVLAEKIRAGRLEDGFTARIVRQKNWSLLTEMEVVKDALAELVEAGWLRPVEHRPPKGQGGKTKVEYLINPKVKKLRTPRA